MQLWFRLNDIIMSTELQSQSHHYTSTSVFIFKMKLIDELFIDITKESVSISYAETLEIQFENFMNYQMRIVKMRVDC